MTMTIVLKEIEERLHDLVGRAASGDDLPPGARYRLEGLMEAVKLAGAVSEAELYALVDSVHTEHCGGALSAGLWDGCDELYPFPSLPLFARRAPVSPTTCD